MTTTTSQVEPIWTPDPATVEGSRIVAFARWLADTGRVGLADVTDYTELWRWSADEPAAFWSAIAEFFGVALRTPPQTVLDSTAMPGAHWFSGARCNIVDGLLDHDPQAPAIVAAREDGSSETISYGELRRRTAALAATLRQLGVQPGDRVVGYLPHGPEAVIGLLASAAVGAVWAVCAPDYAAAAAIARFGQLEPVVLIAADGYRFGGRLHDRRAEVAALRDGLPTVRHTLLVDHAGLAWEELPAGTATSTWAVATEGDTELVTEAVGFEDPLWVLFTSGTTGLPKGIVHGHGGIWLEELVFSGLQFDLGPDDVFFWFTSPNWVMWNILVCGLLHGSTIVLYDGSPTAPTTGALWELVAQHKVTVFGTSPGYLQACERADLEPASDHDLSALRIIGSTGSILPAASYEWVADHVGPRVQVASVSGGTDICGGFVGCAPTTPVWPGEISAPALGVALHAFDSAGHPVIGQVGEMVITAPMPSMPLWFWNDPDGHRYDDAYFAAYPGVWRQGDWITVTERGSVLMHGRSDSTLNRHGVRLGSADIYEAIETMPEIADALVLGIELPDGGYWMPLFVVLTDAGRLDETLVSKLRSTIRDRTSPRHVPDEVIEVNALPRTRTGKKLEVPLKRVLQGSPLEQVLNIDTIDDPAAVRYFENLARTRVDTS